MIALADEAEGIEVVREDEIQTDGQLHDYVRNTVGITLPDKPCCEKHASPFEAFCDAFFARSIVGVWKASRGFGGKTLMLAALAFCEATILGASVSLLGGSGEQSKRAHDYMTGEDTNLPDTFWGWPGAPRHLLLTDPTKWTTRLNNLGRIRVLLASQTSVRAPHPQRLRIDEADEITEEILEAALGQPMEARGITSHTVISSTHQHADGTMTAVLKRAKDRDGWRVFEWCYKESLEPHGWLRQSEVRAKKLTVSNQTWKVEYDLQEPNPESLAIMRANVDMMFREDLGKFAGNINEYIEIEPPMMYCPRREKDGSWEFEVTREAGLKMRVCPKCGKKLRKAKYSTGGDWAKEQDFTIILTWRYDVIPIRLVAFLRLQRMAWPVMVKKFNERVKKYKGVAAHDATGLGDVIHDYLTVKAEEVKLIGATRSDLLSEYVAAIENNEMIAPLIEFMYDEHKLASVADLYSPGKKHHLPDSICAGAVAYRATTYRHGIGV